MDPQPGGAITPHWDEHGTFRGRVVEVLDPRLGTARDLVATEIEGWEAGLRLLAETVAGAGV